MGVLELYDGESRSKEWWRTIKKHTAVVALMLSSLSCAILFVYADIYGQGAIAGYLGYTAVFFFGTWPILIGISMLFPRLSFSFFYWNGWLIAMFFIPSLVLSIILTTFVFGISTNSQSVPKEIFFLQTAILVLTVLIKTAILYNRFKMVSREKNKQRLPI